MASTLLLRALLVSLVATACGATEKACAQAPSRPSRHFESEAFGLNVALPDGWDVRVGSGPVVVTARSGAMEMSVVANRRPEGSGSKGLSEGDVAELWSGFLREIPGAGPDAQPSGQGDAALSGEPGRFAWIRVAPPPGSQAPATMGYSVMGAREGLLVRVGLVAPQAEYRAARQAFDAAVRSFVFTR